MKTIIEFDTSEFLDIECLGFTKSDLMSNKLSDM